MCDLNTLVNRDTQLALGTPSFALAPGRVNTIRAGDIELDFYCRNSRDAARYLTDDRYLRLTHSPQDKPESSVGTSLTTTVDVPLATNIPQPLAERQYVLEEQPLPSRNSVKKYLALDAWTCSLYAVKEYPLTPSHSEAIDKRLALLKPIPLDGPFIRDESGIGIGERLYLRTRYKEDIFTLRDVCDLATLPMARRLLRTLLKMVAQLHQYNIVHNDICVSTVFVSGTFEPDSEILLAGFSEASGDMSRAKSDCFLVFQTVQEFLGQRVKLPKCWTGDEHLDRLWQHLSESGGDNWPCTAEEICSRSDISLSPDMDEPKTIWVSKGFDFRHTSQQDVSYLDVRDVKEYLSKDAVRSAGRAPSTAQVKSLIETAFTALEPCIRNGTITAKDYTYFKEHMQERHGNYNLGLRLLFALPSKYYIRKPIQFSLSFPVPYLSRYGLIILEYLHNLASTDFDPSVLKPLLPFCFEIRGFPEARGVYISITHLDVAAERLGLRIEDNYDNHDTAAADTSLDRYTYQDWYLLAPHPMSRIFPVQRATNRVLTSLPSPSPTYTPLGRFLTTHFDAKTYLDADVVHNPEDLFNNSSSSNTTTTTTTDGGVVLLPPNSCGGSVEATSDDSLLARFRPSALPPPSLLLETKAKRRADETDACIRGLEEARRARRRAESRRPRGDIVPTEFGK